MCPSGSLACIPFVGITGAGGALHTREFAEHAASEEGYRLMDDCAVAMAWVIQDVATSPTRRPLVLERAAQLAEEPRECVGVRRPDVPGLRTARSEPAQRRVGEPLEELQLAAPICH